MKKPTEKELIAALGTMLAEYADIDCMLDDIACGSPEGMLASEKKRQRESNKVRNRIQKLYERAVS